MSKLTEAQKAKKAKSNMTLEQLDQLYKLLTLAIKDELSKNPKAPDWHVLMAARRVVSNRHIYLQFPKQFSPYGPR